MDNTKQNSQTREEWDLSSFLKKPLLWVNHWRVSLNSRQRFFFPLFIYLKYVFMELVLFIYNIFYRTFLNWSIIAFGVGNGNPLQYSCLENSMDRGAWQATFHGVTKSRTWLSTYAHFIIKVNTLGTSLVVQELRIRLAMQGMQVWSLAGELRSHTLQSN